MESCIGNESNEVIIKLPQDFDVFKDNANFALELSDFFEELGLDGYEDIEVISTYLAFQHASGKINNQDLDDLKMIVLQSSRYFDVIINEIENE